MQMFTRQELLNHITLFKNSNIKKHILYCLINLNTRMITNNDLNLDTLNDIEEIIYLEYTWNLENNTCN